MDRREFLLGTLSAGSLLALPSRGWSGSFLPENFDMAPLQRLTSYSGSSVIEGDEYDPAHEIFLEKAGFIKKMGGIPKVTEEFDVVIIGGGISGLSSAWHLNGKKILIIEGNSRFGGNSKSQVYGKNYSSQGAAYITLPEEGDEIDSFLLRLNLKSRMRQGVSNEETVSLNGKYIQDFWNGNTDPSRRDEFVRVFEKLKSVFENQYPELPVWDDSSSARQNFNTLDSISLTSWLQKEFGEIHPHIMEYISLYCWSSFCGMPDEISAAQGLNFLTSDMNGMMVLPGGNGLISEAIFQGIVKCPNVKLANKSFAVDVKSEGGKADVCYKDSSNALKTVRARHCIMASPKLVNKVVLSQVPTDQLKAMGAINYRAYMMANVYLTKKVPSTGYDVFALDGSVPTSGLQDSKKKVFSDCVFADWASNDSSDKSVLSLYLPYPYQGAESGLFVPNLYEKTCARIVARLGLPANDIEGIRLVRYGHAMPLAQIGGVSSGLFERASRSIDNCIHFANQDNWGNPCFETSFGSALRVVERI